MNTSKIITRYAPTPSGYLHKGNAFNFLLIQKLCANNESEIHLRIDDMDSTRMREEYLVDIFETFEWLSLNYDQGPSSVDDFMKNWSQSLKTDYYFSKLSIFNNTFTCKCSRSDIKKLSVDGIYPGTCRELGLKFSPGQNQIRIQYESEDQLKDFVIWRKDNLPSYQLASIIEDIDNKINLIVRGEDLLDSTKAQLFLSDILEPGFKEWCHIIHHPLIVKEDGGKLSKSAKDNSLKELREKKESPQIIIDEFESWYESIKDLIQ